jgi:hypothetical protein
MTRESGGADDVCGGAHRGVTRLALLFYNLDAKKFIAPGDGCIAVVTV